MPGGVTVHVSDEDGDVDIETPTSLQVMYLLVTTVSPFHPILLFFSISFNINLFICSGGLISIHILLNTRNHWNAHSYQERPYLFLVGGGIVF